MDADRWQRVNEIFHSALERPPVERDRYVDSVCGDDDELRIEVCSLLAAHEDAGAFIAEPAAEVAGGATTGGEGEDDDESWVGQTLGPYSISARVGRGGMGVVYRAVDTRLGREVAIKSLARELVLDERSRARLRREAMAAAALSHPGIATVFNLEEIDGHLFIVYEFADGLTLREELATGPCDLSTLAATGREIAEALAAAHRLGIVHRDLKPENVIRVTGNGIKILDFGLATFQDPPAVIGSLESRLTLPGTLLGTPAYMAPEQLRGEEVDFRADLFSFGVLLYELACGVHPFEGGDVASTIARVIETEPAPLETPDVVTPPALRRVVERCLQKVPEERYLRTEDLVAELEKLCALAAAGEPEAVDAASTRLSAGVARIWDGAAAPGAARAEGGADSRRTPGAAADPAADLRPDPGAAADLAAPDPAARVGTPADAVPGAYARPEAAATGLWWWRCHQLIVGFGYFLLLYPLWLARSATPSSSFLAPWAAPLFFVAMAPIVVAGFLRIHLAFSSYYYPEQLPRQRTRAAPLVRVAETALSVLLLGGATIIAADRPFVAAVLLGVAIGLPVVSTLIEPVTTSAAFADDRS